MAQVYAEITDPLRAFIAAQPLFFVATCGFAVPLLAPVSQRDTLLQWAEKQGETELAQYQQRKNRVSIDGLPAPLGECVPSATAAD